jgi:hypothetical protein
MGVTHATAEFIAQAVAAGVNPQRTGTIGRQEVFVGPGRLMRLLDRYELRPPGLGRREFLASFRDEPGMLDPFLRALGAREIEAIDASAYEGADIVHDLNAPLPDALRDRFTLVFDGGTLEHVFNAPLALQSYMAMVEPGGHLIVHTMANNYFGHGFYQLSAEFFFRALAPANGYAVERVVLVENDIAWRRVLGLPVPFELSGPWYEVADPESVRERVVLQTSRPVVIQVLARRTGDVPREPIAPQQSDYAAAWDGEPREAGPPSIRRRVEERVPAELRMEIRLDLLPVLLSFLDPLRARQERLRRSFRNRRHFRRVHD